jgi:hypothetical protein
MSIQIAGQRPWPRPPVGMFSGIIPVQQAIARNEDAIIVLVEIRAFPTGCVLDVVAAVRRGDPEHEPLLDDPVRRIQMMFFSGSSDGPLLEGRLRFQVSFEDGRTVSTTQGGRIPGAHEIPRTGGHPILVPLHGPAGAIQPDVFEIHHPLWLSPLPYAGTFELAVDWPAFGITGSRLTLDGTAIGEAAGRSLSYWE